MEKEFYDNGFRSEHAEQTNEEFAFMEMEFMTVSEISFSFAFCFIVIQLLLKLFTRFFHGLSTAIRNYMDDDCIH